MLYQETKRTKNRKERDIIRFHADGSYLLNLNRRQVRSHHVISYVTVLTMNEIRISPYLWPLGTVNILSWRTARNSKYKKDSLTFPFLPKASHKILLPRGGLLVPRRKEHPYFLRRGMLRRIQNNRPKFPPVYYPSLLLFYPILFSHNFLLFVKTRIKALRFNSS